MSIEETGELTLDFTKIDSITNSGVIPVCIQDIDTKEVLLIAYINKTALEESIRRRKVVLWSTSRNELWYKGTHRAIPIPFTGYWSTASRTLWCSWPPPTTAGYATRRTAAAIAAPATTVSWIWTIWS